MRLWILSNSPLSLSLSFTRSRAPCLISPSKIYKHGNASPEQLAELLVWIQRLCQTTCDPILFHADKKRELRRQLSLHSGSSSDEQEPVLSGDEKEPVALVSVDQDSEAEEDDQQEDSDDGGIVDLTRDRPVVNRPKAPDSKAADANEQSDSKAADAKAKALSAASGSKPRVPLANSPSSKTLHLLTVLKRGLGLNAAAADAISDVKADPQKHKKVVIVSKYVQYFQLCVLPALQADAAFHGITTSQFTGETTTSQRKLVLQAFAAEDKGGDPNNRILLLSLKAGGVGLNLVSASMLIFCDQWWNPFAYVAVSGVACVLLFAHMPRTVVCMCLQRRASAEAHPSHRYAPLLLSLSPLSLAAHRATTSTGQNRSVEIVRLVTNWSIDLGITHIQQRKLLTASEFETGNAHPKYKSQDIASIFKFIREQANVITASKALAAGGWMHISKRALKDGSTSNVDPRINLDRSIIEELDAEIARELEASELAGSPRSAKKPRMASAQQLPKESASVSSGSASASASASASGSGSGSAFRSTPKPKSNGRSLASLVGQKRKRSNGLNNLQVSNL